MSTFLIASRVQFAAAVAALMGLFLGAVSFFYPEHSIELYQLLMQIFNWEVRPIHYERELKTTKWIGAVILVLSALILIALFKPSWADVKAFGLAS